MSRFRYIIFLRDEHLIAWRWVINPYTETMPKEGREEKRGHKFHYMIWVVKIKRNLDIGKIALQTTYKYHS